MPNGRGCGEAAAGCLGLVLGLVLLLIASFVVVGIFETRHLEMRRSRIPLGAVAAADFRLSTGQYPRLTGRLFNNAADSVRSVTILVTVFDCPQANAELFDCTIVGTDDVRTFTAIPPGQARDLNQSVRFPYAMQITGTRKWTYDITEVDAM